MAFETILTAAHELSSRHVHLLRKSARCGCFYCLSTFEPDLINEWVDDATTAICPFCGIDAVIGDASGIPITEAFLGAMRKFWFAEFTDDDDLDGEEETQEGPLA